MKIKTRVTISIATDKTNDDRVKLILQPENLRGFLNSIRPYTKGHRMICEQLLAPKPTKQA